MAARHTVWALSVTPADQCHCAHLCALLHADSSLWRASNPAERALEVAAAHVGAAAGDARPCHARCVARAQRSALAGVLRVQVGRVCRAAYVSLHVQKMNIKLMAESAEILLISLERFSIKNISRSLHGVLRLLIHVSSQGDYTVQ